MKTPVFLGWMLVMTLALVVPVRAITVCYDYVYYRLTQLHEGKGQDPSPPGGAGSMLALPAVMADMEKKGYLLLGNSGTVTGQQLQAGDVIIIPGHIGIVNGPDNIDHFLQVYGASGIRYPASALPLHTPGRPGGYFRGDTLKQFLDRPFRKPTDFQVWRRKTCSWKGNFSGNDTSGYTMTITLTQTGGNATGGWTFFHKSAGKDVTARITWATVVGNTLTGEWTQTGVPMSGNFTWRWLPDGNCNAFEGEFNGTKYWTQMTRR